MWVALLSLVCKIAVVVVAAVVDTTELLRVQDTSHLLQDCGIHYTNTNMYSYMQCQGYSLVKYTTFPQPSPSLSSDIPDIGKCFSRL